MKNYIFLMVIGAGVCGLSSQAMGPRTKSPFPLSSWDRNQAELNEEVVLPIRYPATFERERELFGYNPRFVPAKVSFTPDNVPVMRFGVQGEVGSQRMPYSTWETPLNVIQILGGNGRWRATDSTRPPANRRRAC